MEIHVAAILMQMLNFGIVAAALTYLLLKPVRKILDDRARKTAEGQAAAEAAMAEKAKIGELKEVAQKEAKQEAKAVLSEARQEAEQRKQELLAEVEQEVSTARAKKLQEVTREKEAEIAAFRENLESAIIAITEKLLGEAIDTKKHAKLIDQGLEEIKSA